MASTGNIKVPAPLTDAINGLPDAVFLVMDDGVIIAANSAADKMFGFSHSQLIGSQVDEMMPAEARDYHRKVRTEAASDRRPRHFTSGRTFECERRGGEVFQADIMLSPTKIDGVSMTWAIVRDLDAPSETNAGRQRELNALDVIGHMAASAFDLKNDFAKVAERLKELIPHNRIGVALVCEDDPEMVEIAFLSGDDHPIFVEGERTPISNSATGWVIQKRARVSFTKAKTEFAPAAVLAGFEQRYTEFCGAPLFDDDSVIGMLMLSTRDARGFSEFHKSLIDRLAEHLTVGVVNQRMRGKLQAHARQSEAVGEIGKIISSSPDLDSALAAASKSIRLLVPYDRLSINTVDLDEGVITAAFMDGEKVPGFDKQTHRLPDGAADSMRGMFATGGPLLFDRDMLGDLADSSQAFASYRDAGYHWALIVPLSVTQRPVGLMAYGRKDPKGYTRDEIAIAGRIGEQLAGPVANAFQLTRTKGDARVESILAEIGTVVNTTFDVQEGKHELGTLVGELVDNNSFTISSVTQDGTHLRRVYEYFSGIDRQADIDAGSAHPLAGTTAERTFQTRKPVLVNARSWAHFRKMYPGAVKIPSDQEPKSVINVPLITNDEIFGFLTLRSVKRNAYSESDIAMSVRIGAQLTGSVALSELRRRDADLASERAVLATISGLLGSAVELSDVWSEFAEMLAGLLPFHHISLTEIDVNAGTARVMNDSSATEDLQSRQDVGEEFQLGRTFAADVATSDQGIIFSFEEPDQMEKKYPGSYPRLASIPLKSLIGVPLIWGGEVVAALFIQGHISDRAYTPRDLRLAERVAAQIAGPIAGSLLREQDAALTAERETLARIGSVMGSALDLSEAWPEFAELLGGLLPFHHISLVSIDASTSMVRVEQDWWASDSERPGRVPGDVFPLGGTIAENLVSTRQGDIYLFENPEQWERDHPGSQSPDVANPIRSALAVPLMWGGQVVAALFIHSFEPEAFTQRELRLAERVATQVAGPVAGSLLRAREAELAAERETLAGIGSVMGSAFELSEAWSEFTDLSAKIVKFDRVVLVSIDDVTPSATVLHDSMAGGNVSNLRSTGQSYELEGTVAGNIAETGSSLITNHDSPGQLDELFSGITRQGFELPFRTTLGVPLIWGGKVVACLFFSTNEISTYADADLLIAERIGTQIAGPVAGGLLRERESAVTAERETLAAIGSLLSAAQDFGGAFYGVSELAKRLIDFDAMSLIKFDEHNQTLSVVSFYAGENWNDNYVHSRLDLPVDGSLAGKAISDRRGFIYSFSGVKQLEKDYPVTAWANGDIPARTTIVIPLNWGDQIVAVLWLSRIGEQPFLDSDLALGERIAAQIAGPVAGALLRERDEALIRERSVLTSIGELVGGAPDISSVFKEFSDRLQQLVSFDRMSFHEIDHQKGLVRRVHSLRDGTVNGDPREFPLAGTMAERVAATHQGLLISFGSFEELKGEFPGAPKDGQLQRPRSTIMVPLVWQGEVSIAFSIGSGGEGSLGTGDLELLERVAVQIAGPLAGALARQREAELAEERQKREAAELKAGVLEELNETKSNFVSAMSHELRTPLTSIVAFSDILSRQGETLFEERQLQQVKVIQRNARRLEGMIDELLDLSRMESGRFEIVRSTFDFASMIAESLESSELQFEAMSQTVNFEIVSEVLPINADRGRLLQVVNNLLNNASKYSPNDTEIEIEVTEDEGVLSLEIRDRGPGILGEKPEELFEMFHRADDELTRSVPGTGIGLHVAKRIIEEHGGEITIASRDGGGATARFWIPTGVNVLV